MRWASTGRTTMLSWRSLAGDLYDYELVTGSNALTVIFRDMGDSYAASAVVWLPYEDRNRLALPEWRQRLARFAADNRIKLYMASDMPEQYSQDEVIAFANRIARTWCSACRWKGTANSSPI